MQGVALGAGNRQSGTYGACVLVHMETLNRQISHYIYLITRSSRAKAVKEIKGGYRWDGSSRGGAAALDKVVKEAVPDEMPFVQRQE